MATSKFNADQFAHMNQNSAGIIFVYAGKEGKDTAVHFFGPEFEATAKTQDEILRVVRNCLLEQWQSKAKEIALKEDNNGIATKYRASTPAAIIINSAKGERIRNYDTSASSFAKFGFVPTKKGRGAPRNDGGPQKRRSQSRYCHPRSPQFPHGVPTK